MPRSLTFGAIEGGGTKFVCGIGTSPDDLETTIFPTTTPDETLGQCLAFFRENSRQIDALGIGCFGPVDLNRNSPTFGSITTTPKPAWAGTNVVAFFQDALGIPIGFDTDVNGAALGEGRWGAASGLDAFVYFTIGTGIGAGVIIDGKPVHGLVHPEVGHLRIPRDTAEKNFPGTCPFHGDCLEGVAAGPAIAARWECDPATLQPDHEAWRLEANYLAAAVMNVVLTVSPKRVILGGGVMEQTQLFPLVRESLRDQLNGYIAQPQFEDGLDNFIVPPGLGARAGILGALVLAKNAID
ncbi:MAG: ROK family protein [Verrucomicrobiota bacterium]